jgi:hypothetical protein
MAEKTFIGGVKIGNTITTRIRTGGKVVVMVQDADRQADTPEEK